MWRSLFRNEAIRARRVVVFLDTCYSGGATPGARDLRLETGLGVSAEALQRLRQGVGRVVITWFLMDALRKSGGLIAVEELFPMVRQKVTETVRRQKGASQAPTMHRSESEGRMVIGVAEALE